MAVLTPQQRNTLESAVKQARKVAELGAFNALHSMAVDHPEPFAHMTPEQRSLRNGLRSKARLLGDNLPANGAQKIEHLSYELAYETWHKMLFAKFLEANGLLMHTDGVAVTMEDCEELAKEEGFVDKWDAAANYASKMLPAIFRTDDPLMQVAYATDERIKLESIIDALENQIFIADDALGWVYQFWQSEAKAAINASGDKIDGAKLPAVTQLFTEPYMVHFLIDNTLGAWWVSRNPGVKPPVKFEYLRVTPAPSRSENTPAGSRSENTPAGSRSENTPAGSRSENAPAGSRSENTPAGSRSENTPAGSRSENTPAGSRSENTPAGSRGYYNYFNPYEEIENIKGNLPHWRQEGKVYFVTFRTADSMPQVKLKEWQGDMDTWKAKNPEPHTAQQKKEFYERFPAKMQEYLNAGYGACELNKPEIKAIVENAIKHFNGDRYKLDEFVVAANHVHVLVEPLGENKLSDILHSWKSFTANEINKVIGKQGAFWQKESFDHLVRSEASLEKFREYIKKHVAPPSSRSSEDAFLRLEAGGTFEGWPAKTAQVTSLDPCMGSGHFVASLFPVFAALRMYEEGLSKEEATDKVIAENLHGLELDARCTQIAAFNLALTAWKFCGHYKELPEMNLACSGIAPKGKKEDWIKLVINEKDAAWKQKLENGIGMMYDHFQLAPELGSLLDPSTIKGDPLYTASFEELQPVLKKALENEADTEQLERGVMAAGIAKAGQLLAKKYTLQITNVPYLSRGKQEEVMAQYCEKNYSEAKGDLATVFLGKMLKSNTIGGVSCSVIPQNWLFLTSYKKFREKLLKNETWTVVARLGAKSFQTPMWDFNVMLISITHQKPTTEHALVGLDVSEAHNAAAKDDALKTAELKSVKQKEQLGNPDARVVIDDIETHNLLNTFCTSTKGISTSDDSVFVRNFWERKKFDNDWEPYQTTPKRNQPWTGYELTICFQNGKGILRSLARSMKPDRHMDLRGQHVWKKRGIAIGIMSEIPSSFYLGNKFDANINIIIPNKVEVYPAIFSFCSSEEFKRALRKIDQKISITTSTFAKVPFDLEHWQKVAAEKYPNGLPKPYSDDPTQWLFHGHPIKTDDPLQVALARVLGYRWPAEVNTAYSGVESKNTAYSGIESNNAASGSTESKNTASGGGESKNAASSGVESNNAAYGGVESKNTASSGGESKNAASSGVESKNTAFSGGESINAASGGVENKNAASSDIEINYAASGGIESNNAAYGGVESINASSSGVYDTLADEAKELIDAVKAFDPLTDEDGVFCIPSVNTEQAGAERLREYLQKVFVAEWNNQTITQLLNKAEATSSSLEDYLRKEFFIQHCKLFQNRPFIWHIWDGRNDGFSVLVNYHKLDKDNLSKLIYTYLGDWIRMCEAKKKAGESGAEGLLSAAQKLKEKLEAILEGEAPYDIFVRWKPIEQQPIGWEPDLNDGVRLNIRPFVEAGVLRNKFNVKWGVDRGKNPPKSYWGEVRDNDKNLSLDEKRAAREKAKK